MLQHIISEFLNKLDDFFFIPNAYPEQQTETWTNIEVCFYLGLFVLFILTLLSGRKR